jgi:hypothetical protein
MPARSHSVSLATQNSRTRSGVERSVAGVAADRCRFVMPAHDTQPLGAWRARGPLPLDQRDDGAVTSSEPYSSSIADKIPAIDRSDRRVVEDELLLV